MNFLMNMQNYLPHVSAIVNVVCTVPVSFTDINVGSDAYFVEPMTALYLVIPFVVTINKTSFFFNSITLIVCLMAPYFSRPSKYMRTSTSKWALCFCQPWTVVLPPETGHNTCEWRFEGHLRQWMDPLVTSSYLYIITGATIALLTKEAWLGCLSACAGIASTLYHRSREGSFFNIDATFATSMLVCVLWSVRIAIMIEDYVYVLVVFLGLIFAYRLLKDCGTPNDVRPRKMGSESMKDYVRSSRIGPLGYDAIHVFWHTFSAAGPAVAALLFHNDMPEGMHGPMGGGYVPYTDDTVPIIPAVGLLVGFAFSLAGNLAGGLPWD